MSNGAPNTAANAWRSILAILGALTGVASIVGMLVGAVWTIGAISSGFTELSRRMGLAETQLGALTQQVSGLREAVVVLQDRQPARHAGVPAFRSPDRAPNLWTYHSNGGGVN